MEGEKKLGVAEKLARIKAQKAAEKAKAEAEKAGGSAATTTSTSVGGGAQVVGATTATNGTGGKSTVVSAAPLMPGSKVSFGPSTTKNNSAVSDSYIPTDDSEVRAELRRLCEPITLFAEDRYARRERLRSIKQKVFGTPSGVTMGKEAFAKKFEADQAAALAQEKSALLPYAGSKELEEKRVQISTNSFQVAGSRLEKVKGHQSALKKDYFSKSIAVSSLAATKDPSPEAVTAASIAIEKQLGTNHTVLRSQLKKKLRASLSVLGAASPKNFVRPFTAITTNSFSSEGNMMKVVATGNVEGVVTLWNATNGELATSSSSTTGTREEEGDAAPSSSPSLVQFPSDASAFFVAPGEPRLHDVRCGGDLPHAASNTSVSQSLVAAAARDCKIYCWRIGQKDSTPLLTLNGHLGPVNRVLFGPSNTLVSTSDDMTWRLWDLEKHSDPLLSVQDGGHSKVTGKAVHGCTLHPDGALLTTTDLGGQALTWDLRTGKLAFTLPFSQGGGGGLLGGHAQGCTAAAWDPFSGFTLATGGADEVICLWDIRRQQQAAAVQRGGSSGDSLAPPTVSASGRILSHSNLVSRLEYLPYAAHHQANLSGDDKSSSNFPSPSSTCTVSPVLVSSSLDGTIKYWDTGFASSSSPSTIQCLKTLWGHNNGVRSFAICPVKTTTTTFSSSSPTSSAGWDPYGLVSVDLGKYWYKWNLSSTGGAGGSSELLEFVAEEEEEGVTSRIKRGREMEDGEEEAKGPLVVKSATSKDTRAAIAKAMQGGGSAGAGSASVKAQQQLNVISSAQAAAQGNIDDDDDSDDDGLAGLRR